MTWALQQVNKSSVGRKKKQKKKQQNFIGEVRNGTLAVKL